MTTYYSKEDFLSFANGHLVESACACLLYDAEIECIGCRLHLCTNSEIVEIIAPGRLIVQPRNSSDRQCSYLLIVIRPW